MPIGPRRKHKQRGQRRPRPEEGKAGLRHGGGRVTVQRPIKAEFRGDRPTNVAYGGLLAAT